MNDADAANTTRIEAVKKAVESAEDGANYRVKSGSLNCYSFRDEVFEWICDVESESTEILECINQSLYTYKKFETSHNVYRYAHIYTKYLFWI